MNENISEIEIAKESEIIKDAQDQSAANNVVEENTEGVKEDKTDNTEGVKEDKNTEKNPPHSSTYYEAFANMAHSGIDRIYESINELLIPAGCPIDKRGMKKRMPDDYQEMVLMLAQQLEVSQIEIKGWIAWVLYGNLVLASYGGLIAANRQAVKEWQTMVKKRKENKEAEPIIDQNATSEPYASQPIQEAYVVNPTFKGQKKRGNPHKHGNKCECNRCLELGINGFEK